MKSAKLVCIFLLFLFASTFSEVRLPRLISNGMVLQRDAPVKIWGWAAHGEKVSIHFIDSAYITTADSNGEWNVVLAKLKAGGPFTMQISASNVITVDDIMIGDVYVCSGQSNMELLMKAVSPIYGNEIANSENSFIRHFYVPQEYDFKKPHSDVDSGSWKTANPENVLDFSAVAYFFAKELYDRYKIPIGVINCSLGGSPAESWLSEEALKAFPDHYKEAMRFKDDALIKQIESDDNKRIGEWYSLLRQKDEGYKDPQKPWYEAALNTKDWATMKVPGYWSTAGLGSINGVVWFRKKVMVPSSIAGKEAILILGRIVDADSVYINGVFVGTTSYQYPRRRYNILSNLLKEGENTIVVRVINSAGNGGFVPDKEYEIKSGENTIDLRGDWQYRLGAEMNPLASQTFIRWKPLGLYNAMLAPLLNYRIRGVVWYQGESNAGRPLEYRTLFPALIRDWRNSWNEGDFPFLFVQLPNFMEAKSQPSESNWALLRESQLKTLSVPNTGMAVTIDIGEWNDIHPLDKKDVGKRLALAAEKVVYGDDNVVYSGPIYQSMKVDGDKVVLTFTNIGSGLIAKGEDLKSFAVAGADKQFVWANAKIENDNVVVWSDKVVNPVAVRYAWADNPAGANFYNKDGLPASPFRTDEWDADEK
ncbi:MAG: sialate O-acetylesterase [Bacteroidota bacterium]